MAEKTNKRKVATTVTAVGMAAVLLLGGTFAWQSISQEATNIVSAAVNPGGRLHDDFDGSNDKNIYVENFGTQNIYARIKLSEYLEIGQDAGNFAEGSNRDANLANGDIEVLLGGEIDTKSTYTTYKYGETNLSDEYWTKDWDGSTKYIPTFNKDQDSLEADLNGTYEYTNDAGENVPYGDFVDYNTVAADYSETDTEWYDADTNDSAEAHVNPDSVTGGSHEIKEDQTHALADSIDGTVISMADWDGTAGEYWVYDTDGWAYWAQAIEPGTATGLLLDSITDLGLIDEDYYYAIHVTGQFITAGDLGQDDNTGFYADGEVPTDDALTLLDAIGVKVNGENDGGDEGEDYPVTSSNTITVNGWQTADENGYIYLTGLSATELNEISVEVAEDVTLMENGLTAQFNDEYKVEGTDMQVSEENPNLATLYIAANDRNAITITAATVNGEYDETVTIVPIFDTLIVTPDMGGTEITVSAGPTALEAQDFDNNDNVTYELGGEPTRSVIMDLNGVPTLSIGSAESKNPIYLIATDGTKTVTITLNLIYTYPDDSPSFSWYKLNSGSATGEGMEYNEESLSGSEKLEVNSRYHLGVSLINSFEGTVTWKLEGMTNNNGTLVSGFETSEEDTTLVNTIEGITSVLSIGEETGPLKLTATVTEGEETTNYVWEITFE